MCRVAVVVAFLLGPAVMCLGSEAPRVNFVLIISDDQAWTDYGFMGHPHIDTPHLDGLAAESLTYTRGYVAAPLCRPSLAAILTGLPAHLHGTTGNDPAAGDATISNMASRADPRYAQLHDVLYQRLRALPNFVRLLQEAGYATMQTGKWWEADPVTFGFTRAMTHGNPARGARHGDEGLTISREGISPIREFLDDCGADEDRAAQPFFVWHAPFLPHAPHNPPPELLAKYEELAPSEPIARYWAMCEWFDATCGELLQELDDRGLRESTVVIYITDNGWIQHPAKRNAFAPRSKRSPYEGGIRTPVMVRWPSRVSPVLNSSSLVSAIDIAPTILRIAGLAVPEAMPGIELRDGVALQERNTVFGSAHPHDIHDVERPSEDVEARYVIRGPWKLIARGGHPDEMELYHLEADPHEETNLAAARPNNVQDLTRELQRWWERGSSD